MLPNVPTIISRTKFFNASQKYLREAKKYTKPLVISHGERPEFIIFPAPLYEEVLDAWNHWREERILAIVEEGRNEYRAGQLKPINSLDDLG